MPGLVIGASGSFVGEGEVGSGAVTGIVEADGSSAGIGAASAVAVAFALAVASAAGTAVGSGVGEDAGAPTVVEADGAAAGVAAVSGVAAAIATSTGSSIGLATGTGVGAWRAAGLGASAGVASPSGVSGAIAAAVGATAGAATVNGQSPAPEPPPTQAPAGGGGAMWFPQVPLEERRPRQDPLRPVRTRVSPRIVAAMGTAHGTSIVEGHGAALRASDATLARRPTTVLGSGCAVVEAADVDTEALWLLGLHSGLDREDLTMLLPMEETTNV